MGRSRIGQAPLYRRDAGGRARVRPRVAGAVLAGAVFALGMGVGAGSARPARSNQVTLNMLAYASNAPGWNVLIPNFERVDPNITIDITYAPTLTTLYQLETTELAAGNGPDLLSVWPGCGTPISVCVLAKDGYLAPLLNEPWTKRSIPLVTSASKYGQGLFVFSPSVTFDGIFTNDDMFKKLGLQVPQTFSQLLTVCAKAKAAGTIPMLLGASGSGVIQQLLAHIALTTVYASDPRWGQQLKAGTVTFDGTPGWHAALQDLVDMNNAACFEPGPAALTTVAADGEFAQGQALMYLNLTAHKGAIDAGNPQFTYSQHPFPSGNDPSRTMTLMNLSLGPSVNARSSPANQAAARTFVDFAARPAQDALYVQLTGGVTQYQLLKQQLPGYLSSFVPTLAAHRYAVNPVQTWWNADVGNALTTYGTGLLTGQDSIDDDLKAMDAAWQEGPS
jgi:raffinose/stachyose/melibiose transport system substrate-binding protein